MSTWMIWVAAAVVLLPVLFFALAGLQWWTRMTPLRRVRRLDGEGRGDGRERTGDDDGGAAPPVGTDDFLEAIEPHLGTRFDPGHTLELFFSGDELYPRLLEDLASARSLVTWHVFWFRPGRLADRVREILCERARDGVRVLFLHDWYGSRGIDDAYFRELEEAGVEVRAFRKPNRRELYKLQQRSHSRTVVIDGRIGWSGGFAIADEWLGDGRSEDEWRDTSVRFEGPAVHQLQAAFAADWVETTGELLIGPATFPASAGGFPDEEGEASGEEDAPAAASPLGGDHAPDGNGRRSRRHAASPDRLPERFQDAWAALFYSSPSLGGTVVERLFALTIEGARRRLWITAGYFVPSERFRAQLVGAARRGVDVRVLHPGKNTDRPPTWYAARRHYEALLQAGIRVFEYEPTMIHAKTLIADDTWCAIGTTNFDNRSMALNDEVSLLVRDEAVTARLADRFEEDLEHAREIDLESHRRRGNLSRATEWLSERLEPVL